MVFGDHSLGSGVLIMTGSVIVSQPFQWAQPELGNEPILSINLYREYVCVCVDIYIVKVEYIMRLYWCAPQNSSRSHSSYTSISLFFKLKVAVLNHTDTSYSFTLPHTTRTIISE